MNSKINFALLFLARSGSTWLSSLLSSHQDIYVDSEILAGTNNAKTQMIRMQRSFKNNSLTKVAGIQVKLTDIVDLTAFDRFLVERDVKIVFLKRNNVVKKTVSFLNGARLYERTGQWNLDSNNDRLGAMTIDPNLFMKTLERTDQRRIWANHAVEEMNAPRIELCYEDLLKDVSRTISPLLNFLEVEERELESGIRKNTPDTLSQVLTNYDELREMYKGSRFENMFT